MVLWVFGYASLVWNPGFEYDEKIIGYIKGYRRVFNLACIDHRGTPEKPARICTLEAVEGAVCWGAAYSVKGGEEKERAAMEYLEGRECEYDLKIHVDFYKEKQGLMPTVTGVLVFASTADKEGNKYYLGAAPPEEMASQIAHAFGPCGNNREYLFSLEKAMSNIGHVDDYVIELADEVMQHRHSPGTSRCPVFRLTTLLSTPAQTVTAWPQLHLQFRCPQPGEVPLRTQEGLGKNKRDEEDQQSSSSSLTQATIRSRSSSTPNRDQHCLGCLTSRPANHTNQNAEQIKEKGSGSSYLYGFFDQAWREGMTRDEAENLVVKAVSLAIARDGASGGVVRTVTINSEGVTRKYYPGDTLPLWHEEIEAHNSLLDLLSHSGPEPMTS